MVTGLGIICPVGNNIDRAWEGICAGRSGVDAITAFDPSSFKTRIAAEVKGFDPAAILGRKEARRADRYAQFAMAAVTEAVRNAALPVPLPAPERTGVFISSATGGMRTLDSEGETLRRSGPNRVSPFLVPMMLSDNAAGLAAIHIGARGPNLSIASACASAANAIGEAAEVIRRGAADVMIAGGAEAAVIPIAVAGFSVMGTLSERNDAPAAASRPFDRDRDGFIIGEGAGILILEELDFARARGAPLLAELAGYGTTNDAHHISAPLEDGSGAAGCMRLALGQAGLTPSAVDYINAHGTSTPLNDKSETRAIKSVFGAAAHSVAISSTKSMTGHLLGAAGGIEAVFTVLALRDGIVPPTINLDSPDPECDLDYTPLRLRRKPLRTAMSNSFGFGGHNAALVFTRLPETAA
ncbi:MAG: beta-ketoacyl-ACP synthase II [Anaerolineales bacterium]|nr:beta-ketoacyl-ACP synthase II [Anaerolineales bacterium]